MTGIDTTIFPNKFWKSGAEFLEAIEFVSLETDELGNEHISLLCDEEGNSDIKLNKESVLWLIYQLQIAHNIMNEVK